MILTNVKVQGDVNNASLINCLVLGDTNESTCVDTVSVSYTNCVTTFCISRDGSADGEGSLNNQDTATWFTVDNEINEIGQAALTGISSTGGNIIEWNWAEAVPIVTSTLSGVIDNMPVGTYTFSIVNVTDSEYVESRDITFTDESFSEVFELPVGTELLYATPMVNGDENTGAANFGVTA